MSHNTMSHPTYINSSTSISEPIKPFDGLDHNYTPEEYLQHIYLLQFHREDRAPNVYRNVVT